MDRATIAKVQRLGFDVWLRRESDPYMIFTDREGKRLGYLQENGGATGGGWTLCTVHKPNMTTGTGYLMAAAVGDFTARDLERCFAMGPDWAYSRDLITVKKYRDMDEYRARGIFESAYAKMEAIDA